jgi:Putative Actinobacterial Holin-X, holin superfamily III
MPDGGDDHEEKPIGELFGQLIDEGKAYAKAELGLVKASAEAKADAAKKPALLGAAALLFLIAGVVVFSMTLALALATLVGPLAGGLIAAVITLGIAAVLGLLAKQELGKLK